MTTISDYIRQDIEARVALGDTLPYRLTLAAMSSFYAVSPMPVRTAVQQLIEQKILVKGSNGRLGLAADPAVERWVGDPPPPPKSLEDHERKIAEYAVELSLEGAGPYLREEDTAARFGIGRSRVRRIFSRLSGAGALEHVPRCGWRVVPYREADMIAYVEVREILEVRALELASDYLDDAELARLLEANSPADDGSPRLDNSLHAYWIGLSQNRYIEEWFRLHGPYYESLFDYATAVLATRVDDMARQHRRILQALLDRDPEGAKQALVAHIRGQKPTVLELIGRFRRGEGRQNGSVVDLAPDLGSGNGQQPS